MAINFKTIFNGLKIKAKAVLTGDSIGDLEVDSVTTKLNYHNGTSSSPVVTESSTATLTNKTFTSPSITSPTGITATDVGLGNVTNTSDVNKPVSTAQQSALDLKANIASPTFTGTVGGITATMVGLGNVDNTSDVNKPVSTAQQTALNLKINLTEKGAANGVATLDANSLIPVAQLPPAAIERLVIVADQTARFALTTTTIQNGDTVKQTDTNVMYFVKDDTNLSSALGYEAYTAGAASSVAWGGITGIPSPVSSLTGSNTGDQTATTVASTPSGNLAATNVQAALNELQSDIDTRSLITSGSVITPTRLDMKKDTKANLITYASTAADGQLVFATDTLETFVIKTGALSAVGGGGGISAWVTATAYVIGDKVEINNRLYKALTAHTSGTFATDLAAVDWVRLDNQATDLLGAVPIANGGTGATTKAAGFDALSPMTTAGDIIYGGTSGTGTRLGIGTESQTLRILSGVPAWGDYDPNNLLVNPAFENSSLTGWTCTTGTCTSTNTSGEFSDGLRAMKVALSASAMNVSQSVATLTGSTTQYIIGVNYRVPATMTDFQICTLIAGAEATCVPSANLIKDDTFHTIEIPQVITPGSTVGIKFKTTSAFTANAYFDKAYIKQGLGTQALQLDNVYSAQITTSSGTVSNLNKAGWISCSAANPTVCTFATGVFSSSPNCTATVTTQAANGIIQIAAGVTSTSITVGSYTSTNGAPAASIPFTFTCQKSGNDYLSSSSAVYSQASANYGQTFYTPTITVGTISAPSANYCMHSREGQYLDIECRFTTGTTSATLFKLPLPSGLVISSNYTANSYVGMLTQNSVNASGYQLNMVALGGLSYLTLGEQSTSNGLTDRNSDLLVSNIITSIKARVAIQGWSNSAQIVGSFAGYTNVPGTQTNNIIFGATVGATCSTSPCTITNKIGSTITTITRSAAGTYSANWDHTLSQPPICTVVVMPNVTAQNQCKPNAVATTTNQSINCMNTTALLDEGFIISCFGVN